MSTILTPIPLLSVTTAGGTKMVITPYSVPPVITGYPVAIPFVDFNSTGKMGAQTTITILFDKPIDYFEITAKSSNKTGKKAIAYDVNGNKLGEMGFGWGSTFVLFRRITLGEYFSTRRMEIPDVRRIELVPGSDDAFFWGNLKFRPQDVAVITEDPKDPPNELVVEIPLQIRAVAVPRQRQVGITTRFNVKPAVPIFADDPQSTASTLRVNALPIRMEDAITDISDRLTAGKVDNYYDQDREFKTLLNFGNDTQELLVNWMKDPVNFASHGILAKLYEPLPARINPKSLVWISREISPTLLDQVLIVITPAQQVVLYLRPPNRNVEVAQLTGVELNNVTLNDLLVSGSAIFSGPSGSDITANDPVLQQWYTTALEGVALNVDYTDYNNFVHFSSAESRLSIFRQKLVQMEGIQGLLNFQATAASASLATGSVTHVSGTTQYAFMLDLANQKQEIVRSFDGYERFLYYNSGSFTGSLSGLIEDEVLEIADVSWPKASGSVRNTQDALSITFYETQGGYAADYDNQNAERLVLNIPEFIQGDADSDSFITFLNMIGHHFDTIKLYIDQMPEIYDRSADPDSGLAPELLWTVGKSLGINLPNQYAIKNLLSYTVGSASVTQKSYAQAITETWKRFIHNQIYVSKTKGTQTGLMALRNTYGVLPQLVRLQESVSPSSFFSTGSFELFDELTSVLTFNSGARVEIPFSSSIQDPSTIEVRFSDTAFASGTILTAVSGSDKGVIWSLIVVPTGSAVNERGVLHFISTAGNLDIETPVGDFLSGDYFNIMLRRNSATLVDLTVKSYADEIFTYAYGPTAITSSITGSWADVDLYLGNGSYSMSIDEVRVWSEVITDGTFDNHTRFPGLYAGNTSASAGTSLVVRHSFNKPHDLVATASVTNETPWANATGSLATSVAVGFNAAAAHPYQFDWLVRQTQRFTANAGGNQYSSNLITIAPPATFKPGTTQVTGSSLIPVLDRHKRIRATPSGSITFGGDEIKGTTRIGFYLTLAESINDSIMRSMGAVDLNQLIGNPLDLYNEIYGDLTTEYQFYVDTYSPVFNYNTFARLTEGLLDGMFQQAKQNIPSAAKMLTGIVIEPPLLERNRVVLNKPLKVEGSNTRREANARTILATEGSYPGARYAEADIENSGAPDPLADMKQVEADIQDEPVNAVFVDVSNLLGIVEETYQDVLAYITQLNPVIDLQNTNVPVAFITQLGQVIDTTQTTIPYALITSLLGVVPTEEEFSILATAPFYDAIIDADVVFTDPSASAAGEGGTDQFVFEQVKSTDNFENPAATTYFVHPTGSFGLLDYEYKRIREGLLLDRGIWQRGTLYRINDMITDSTGSEYRCLTDKVLSSAKVPVPFVSYVEPRLDTRNWTPVTYIRTPKVLLFRAVVSGSNGDVAIVPAYQPNTAYVAFTGYSPKHFKFFRNTGRGWVNARYDGCLQTNTTTIDGKEPVEVFPSSEAQLFVKSGKPVQDVTDEGGLTLDVR